MKKSFLFLANGFEEMEAIAVADILLRGGVELQTVSLASGLQVKGAHGIEVTADIPFGQLKEEEAECLIFPGGMPGAQNIADHREVIALLQRHYDKGLPVAAICAAPALVLSQLNAGRKLRLTCYPGFEKYLSDAVVLPDAVVIDGSVITGKGPGFAVRFGMAVLEQIRSTEVVKEVAAGMLL